MTREGPARAALAALVALVVSTAGPVAAREKSASPFDRLRVAAFEPLERARDLVATGSLSDAVAAASGSDTTIALPEPAPVPAGLPGAIARPVGLLLAAVREAETLAGQAVRTTARGAVRLEALYGRLEGSASPDPAVAERFRTRVETAFEPQATERAALVLASAIDQALPGLRAYAAAHSTSTAQVVGCDVVDVENLCVGGQGQNTFEKDKALLIDLGGDDVHANSAGGAAPGVVEPGNGLAVSVTLDLGGADRYTAAGPSPGGAPAVQGGSVWGGVGVLVDAAGNDAYSATGRGALAQGFSAFGAAGILADLGGNDSYLIASRLPGSSQGATGLGYGVGGLGVALDASGDDTYLVEAQPEALLVDEEGTVHPGNAVATAFGFAAAGSALFTDGGGSDSMRIHGATASIAPDDNRPLGESGSTANGFGYAILGGSSLALFGPGPTSRTVLAETAAPEAGPATAIAYGVVLGGGAYGGIHDAGGDDTYVAQATTSVIRHRTIDDSCSCSFLEIVAQGAAASVVSSGYGSLGGVGALHDTGGNDRYMSAANTVAEALLRDERTDGIGARATVAGAAALVSSQGYGETGATGVLEDTLGNDVYEARTTAEVRGEVSAPPGRPTEIDITPEAAVSAAQAVGRTNGTGILSDLGGNDAYSSVNRSWSTFDGETHEVKDVVHSVVQAAVAAGNAVLQDLDGSAYSYDTFQAEPARPACMGARGEGTWVDCGQGAGVGING